MAENGNMYTLTLTMDEEGNVMWSAAYVTVSGTVTVASLSLSIPAMRAEDGTWTAVHPLTQETVTLAEGGTIDAGPSTYMLSSDGEGNWMASLVMPDPVSVTLGEHGGTRILQRAEDGNWWVGEMVFKDGEMLTGDNGHYYTLTLNEEGTWMAMWQKPDAEMVAAGHVRDGRAAAGRGSELVDRRDGVRQRRHLHHGQRQRLHADLRRGGPQLVVDVHAGDDGDHGHGSDGHVARGPGGLRRDGVG